MDRVPENIAEVLSDERAIVSNGNETTAVFYSISNCQKGLKGISFGNFLIKQVANAIRTDFPNIKDFVTLSPVPDFMEWTKSENTSIFQTIDNKLIESVSMVENSRHTLCISSQIGCSVDCSFCATGKMGFKQNLSTGEIVDQLLFIKNHIKTPITNIVFMGMG